MNPDDGALCEKIARLVQERGWNQEEFSRLANLNRLTIRGIFQQGGRRLHNATVGACARALGVTVNELRDWPLERLLPRMAPGRMAPGRMAPVASPPLEARRGYEAATQPALAAWMEREPERAAKLSATELDELLSLQGTGGPLTDAGVEHYTNEIERKRRLLEQVAAVSGTEYIDLLEQFVSLLYEKIQPYRGR